MSESLLVPTVLAMSILMVASCVSRWLAKRATQGNPIARYKNVETICASATVVCGGLYMLSYIYAHSA